MKSYSYLLVAVLMCITLGTSCSTKNSILNTNATTDDCVFMKEVCAEAEAFMIEYNTFPEEEKRQMAHVLNTYISHCEKAQKACKKSLR